ncbi:hypothetical protein [Deinococcus ruber]|uniref:Uncharacterized protein n=1 Tax=Deinococcus ruber TaxID=1848197 RepID=A0A918CBX8_9DEIO|nr:hypothetical protein [Deinococcus ruber]GGR13461.1 hypothetical protein GCM10008957_28020 [Deinococcus ruber]
MDELTLEDMHGEHWNLANDHAADGDDQEPADRQDDGAMAEQVGALKTALRTAQLQWIRQELVTLGCGSPRQLVVHYELLQGLPTISEALVDEVVCPGFLGSDAVNELSALILFDFDPDAPVEAWHLTYTLSEPAEALPF